MTKKQKLLIPLLFTALSMSSIFTVESFAEESSGEQTSGESAIKDENAQRLEKVTGIDENGNVFEVEDTGSGVVESSGKAARAATVNQVVNFRTKGNAVTSYTEDGTGVAGYTNGAYGGDAAYLGTSGGKVKFMLSGVVGWVPASEVQVLSRTQVAVVSCYQVSGGSLIHKVAHDITTPGWATSINNGAAPSYLSEGGTYYSYDGHYFYKDYAVMIADYQNNTRSHSVNSNNPFYNYFQYLPLRSSSRYGGSELTAMLNGKIASSSSKLRNTGSQFVNQQNTYGVNALLMASVGANESGWGTSTICQQKNNLFGLNAVDSSPGTSASTYASVDECIRQFSDGWMSRGYLYPNDSRYKGGFLGNKGSGINLKYASDPYWGEKAASIAWNLDKNGGSKDNGYYTIGVKDTISTSHNSINVRNSNSTSSAVLYLTGNATSYSVLILDQQASNSFYKVQSDAVLNSGRTAVASGVGKYNFANMYAYISSGSITVVNSGKAAPAAKTLQSIVIGTPPAKTVYTEGDKFDASGMVVKAKWSDGTETDVTKNITYGTTALAKGATEITIQYTDGGVSKTVVQKISVKEKATVSQVLVNPNTAELKAGSGRTFGVAVTGTGNPVQTVNWSVEGAKSTDTKIDSTGKLQISANETAETLTVKAVSTADTTKVGTSIVKVVCEPVQKPDTEKPDVDASVPGEVKPEDKTPEGDKPDDGIQDDESEAAEELVDEATGIRVSGKLPENAELKINIIEKDDSGYDSYIEPVKNNTVLGVYDIDLGQKLGDNETVQLGFKVDDSYSGQKVIIYHYAEVESDIFTEKFETTVVSGTVTIEVGSFSPYVIALDDADGGSDNSGITSDIITPGNTGTGGLVGNNNSSQESTVPKVPDNTLSSNKGGESKENVIPSDFHLAKGADNMPSALKADVDKVKSTGEGKPVITDKKNKTQNLNPKTGDNSNAGNWILLMISSGTCIALCLAKSKKATI